MTATFSPLSAQDQALLDMAGDGLPLSEAPFAELGRRAGMSADAVLMRLGALAACGYIEGLKLVTTGPDALHPQDALDIGLLDALASGLPLVARPWEALGALLGVPSEAVRQRVLLWQQRGELQCIAPALCTPPAPD
jgi:DNA-binding Lrp family transcriptional regulator